MSAPGSGIHSGENLPRRFQKPRTQKKTAMRKITIPKRMLLLTVVFFNLIFAVNLSSQCNFGCIDTVNVSVNNLCTATITPSMVLKGFNPSNTCNYGIELFDQNSNLINLDFTRADVGPQYVGSTLKIRVFEAGVNNPNSCWGYITIEDKLPPDIVCVGNDTLDCYRPDIFADEAQAELHLKSIIESTLIDNCGNEEVTVNITRNDLVRMLCQDTMSAMRIVGYNVLDNNLNITSCEDTIFYARFPLDSLDAPKNFVENMSISCNDPYPTVAYLIGIDSETPGNNSVPNIGGISIADYSDSLFTERGLCNFKMTTSDLIFPTCGNTFKIVRNWTVIDWCNSSAPKVFNQVIKVVDDNVNLNSNPNIGPLDAESGLCDISVDLPFPTVSANECNSWTYTISVREPGETLFFPFGGVRDSMPTVVSRRFVVGTTIVRYEVTDACGNMDSDEFNVVVRDNEAPIPVCDFRTVVTLNDSFLGKVGARSFDDGSFDYCSEIASYKVRRVDRLTSACATPADFDDYVKFCCEDIGQVIMVELQVTDGAGLTATCMAEARVQYKGAGPSVTCAPDIGTQDCTTFDDFDISTLTPPIISSTNPCVGNRLTAQIREVDRNIDDCGDGYIDIEWYYNLTGEDEVICTNRVVFANPDPFTLANITWPQNRTVESCSDAPPTAEELAALIDTSVLCSNVFASEPTDRMFDNVPGTCVRILRTWTVVDWCRYPADPNARWTFEQTIDVVNSSEPVIDISGGNLTLDPKPDSCRAHMVIEGIATDDCTAPEDLSWTYRLDLVRNGQEIPLIFERPGRILERRIDAGEYILTWTATDGCGNTALARQNFTIEDNILPTAICGFAIRDIGPSGMVSVSAAELDGGSTDNCNDGLTYGIRRDGDTTDPTDELTFTCSDIGVNSIQLWVSDFMGNESVCLASVDIRDGQSACGFGAGAISVEGSITTPEEVAVESAQVELMANEVMLQSEMTEIDGQFLFNDLASDERYVLSASKNDDYINGVSTLDIILMQRHILGLQLLDTPYKVIAADINNNESISAVDMVILRRLILGHIEAFPDNDSWRFIDKDYTFDNPLLPWPVIDAVDLGTVEASMNQELLAIKIGDLNATAIANSGFASPRSDKSYGLIHKTTIDQGALKLEVIASRDILTLGYQLGLAYDQSTLRLSDVRSNDTYIVDEMIHDADGLLKISVANARVQEYRQGDVMLEISFDISGLDKLSDHPLVIHQSDGFRSEIYTDDLKSIRLEFDNAFAHRGVVLHQNRPNPFDTQTLIEFEIPKEDQVTFELFDINGSRVYGFEDRFGAGHQQIIINREDLALNKGIYYYQIHTDQRSLIKKMIVL